MRILVVYCHPCDESFSAAIRDTAVTAMATAGHNIRLTDLYAQGFNPVMEADERRGYHTAGDNERPIADHLDDIRWAEGLVFIYPTWWYGLPAMLKGWLDRVWVPHSTFTMPVDGQPIKPLMTNIRKISVVTTCGAPFWWSVFVGQPGRRTLLTGIRALCHPRCRTQWMAHYLMDSSTQVSRERFLAKVKTRFSRL